MMQQGYAAYRTAAVDTADQGKLILIAYDIAIKNCKMAIDKFDIKDKIEERTKHLFKAQDAVTELLSALRVDVGEVAQNLYKLYDYILRSLVDAGVRNNKNKIVEVVGYLESLRDAWDAAIRQLKAQIAPTMDLSKMAVKG
jgi:flagellar secretion chaperone FliS